MITLDEFIALNIHEIKKVARAEFKKSNAHAYIADTFSFNDDTSRYASLLKRVSEKRFTLEEFLSAIENLRSIHTRVKVTFKNRNAYIEAVQAGRNLGSSFYEDNWETLCAYEYQSKVDEW